MVFYFYSTTEFSTDFKTLHIAPRVSEILFMLSNQLSFTLKPLFLNGFKGCFFIVLMYY
jgi:hypothetical protein